MSHIVWMIYKLFIAISTDTYLSSWPTYHGGNGENYQGNYRFL